MSSERPSQSRDRWHTLRKAMRVVWFLLALGLLIWLLDHIGWSTIGDSLIKVGWAGAGLLLFLGLLESTLDAAALKATVGHKVGLLRGLTYSASGAIVNVIIPLEAGEVVKGTLMKRHMTTQEAISGTILWNYLFKLTRPAAALFAALVAFLFGYDIDNALALIVVAACVASFAPFLIFKLLIGQGLAGLTVKLLKLLRILRKDPEKIVATARELDEKIKHFRQQHPTDYFLTLVFQFCARLSGWAAWTAAIWLIGLDYSFGLCALIYAGMSVAGYIVMFFPVRIGVGEGAGYLLFAIYGLDPGMGLIAAVISRLKTLLANGGASLFALIGRGEAKEKNND